MYLPVCGSIRFFAIYSSKKCIGVILDFIGGEPFLQPKLIDEIITYFRKQTIIHNHPWQYNWCISISSNGTLYFNPEV
jgi:sulfatase maturation enzyme AslB (radical SAM superfamily)